ncbi:MAG: hypothetical protein CME06_03560, partial [Gemmatimonadetes bacterium]|nr:hypothetical protein [Gemmatimonadota bacterium]
MSRAGALLLAALSPDRAPASTIARICRSGDSVWEELKSLAIEQQVLPALYFGLARIEGVPPEVLQRLSGAYVANVRRNERMRAVAVELAAICRDRGISAMALKGLALIETGVYRDAGVRALADVDILVPSASFADLYRELRSADWKQLDDGVPESHYLRHTHQAPPLVHAATGHLVEIHREPWPRQLSLRDGSAGIWKRSTALAAPPGLRAPSPADLVVQAAIHTLLHSTARFMGLVDIATILRIARPEPAQIAQAAEESGARRQVAAMIHLALRTCGPRSNADELANAIAFGAGRAMTRTGIASRLLRNRPHWIEAAPFPSLHPDPA